MIQDLGHIEQSISKSGAWEATKDFLGRNMSFGKDINISIFDILVIISVIFFTTLVLRMLFKLITRKD
jgi:hypothetical protein